MKNIGIWTSLILSVAAVAPVRAAPEKDHDETTNVVVKENGKNIEITIHGDKVIARVDGLKISPDHVRLEGNRIILLDQDGEPMEDIVIAKPPAHPGGGDDRISMMFMPAERPPVMLGILMDNPGEALRAQLGVSEHAALIEKVMDDLPASKAGLETWDIIVEVNGDPLDEPGELHNILMRSKPGDELDVVVIRHAEEQELTIELEAYDAEALGQSENEIENGWYEKFGIVPGGPIPQDFWRNLVPGDQGAGPDLRREFAESMREFFGRYNRGPGGVWRFDDRGRLVRPDDDDEDWRDDMADEFERRLEDLEEELSDRLEQLEDRWEDMEDMFDRLLGRLDEAIRSSEDRDDD